MNTVSHALRWRREDRDPLADLIVGVLVWGTSIIGGLTLLVCGVFYLVTAVMS